MKDLLPVHVEAVGIGSAVEVLAGSLLGRVETRSGHLMVSELVSTTMEAEWDEEQSQHYLESHLGQLRQTEQEVGLACSRMKRKVEYLSEREPGQLLDQGQVQSRRILLLASEYRCRTRGHRGRLEDSSRSLPS